MALTTTVAIFYREISQAIYCSQDVFVLKIFKFFLTSHMTRQIDSVGDRTHVSRIVSNVFSKRCEKQREIVNHRGTFLS